jgi:beta-galactosidase GanA
MTEQRPSLPDLALGVQYYRQPTPLPAEWEEDLAAIKQMGFDIIQLRPQWRWHERNEGELDFSDIDRLFELAEAAGLRVIFKFFLETAPDWLFDHYEGARVAPDGSKIHPYGCGAFYIGGVQPCFDKTLVRAKAAPFIKASVERYRGRQSLIAWHIWNEPRSRPATDCACHESMERYRGWLRDHFGSVEELNRFGGLAISGKGGDFKAIKAPITYDDYLGWMLFRSFRAEMVSSRLQWISNMVRSLDPTRPIISHAGFCSALQDVLEDTSDDRLNARHVDIYGSSCPNRPDDLPALAKQPQEYTAATVDLICARMRGVSDPFWMNEIYANRGMYRGPSTPAYLRQTTYGALAGGARGLVYWQYRSERLTTESNDSGLVEIDGKATDRSREVARDLGVIRRCRADLAQARTPRAKIGVIYDFGSDLISRIETAAPGQAKVVQGWREDYPYKNSLRGIHLLLWRLDQPLDLVPAEDLERYGRYRALYLPCPRMLTTDQASVLTKFVRAGGLLISEPSPGLRQPNLWAAPRVPSPPLDAVFGCREGERLLVEQGRVLSTDSGDIVCPADVFLTTQVLDGAAPPKVLGVWSEGGAAITDASYGKGHAILLGAPLGEVYFRTRSVAAQAWLERLLSDRGLLDPPLLARRHEEVRVRRLLLEGSELIFLFNLSDRAKNVGIRRRGYRVLTELTDLALDIDEGEELDTLVIPPQEVAIFRLEA